MKYSYLVVVVLAGILFSMTGRMLAIIRTEIIGMYFMRAAAFMLVVSAILAGCVSERIYVWADVKDRGPDIMTRYRYRIAGYESKCPVEWIPDPDEWRKENGRITLKRYSDSFSRFQPDVFSDTGIPIVLKELSTGRNNKVFPTVFLSILSFFALPGWIQESGEDVIAIYVGNADIDIGKVTIGWDSLVSLSSIIPSSWVLYSERPDCAKDTGYSTSIFIKDRVFFDNSQTTDQNYADRVVAYIIASRLKELEDSGQMDAILLQYNNNVNGTYPRNAFVQKPLYRIVSFDREAGHDFAYAFALEMNGDPSIETFFGIRSVFAREVLNAYKMEHPEADVSVLRVDVQPRLVGGRIEGRAAVLTIVPISFSYDSNTRRGKMSVRFNAEQAKEAREWIRKNIETLSRDKNIVHATDQTPPGATYYSLDEKIDGDVMEMEFKTE